MSDRAAAPRPERGTAIGIAAAGWVLLGLAGPVALFLTWWGDCSSRVCAVPTDLDRAVYGFDLAAFLLFPAIAFLAYRGWRPASVALVIIGCVVLGQVVASLLGIRAFQAFAVLLPAGALLTLGGVLGLGLLAGRDAEGRPTSTGRELAGLATLAVVVAILAVQGLAAGGGGPLTGFIVLVAVALTVITIIAFVNRGKRRDRPPQRALRGRRRG